MPHLSSDLISHVIVVAFRQRLCVVFMCVCVCVCPYKCIRLSGLCDVIHSALIEPSVLTCLFVLFGLGTRLLRLPGYNILASQEPAVSLLT